MKHLLKYFRSNKSRCILLALYFSVTISLLCLYCISSVQHYYRFWLLNFDYGITFNAVKQLQPFVSDSPLPGLLFVRGVHVLAHNQQYLHAAFGWIHFFSNPHQLLLLAHAVGIFSTGVFVFYALKANLLAAMFLSLSVWLSPLVINLNHDLVHTEAFALPLLVLMHVASMKKSKTIYLWAFLALMAKVDVAITVGAYGFISLLMGTKATHSRATSLIILGMASAVFLTNFLYVIPETKALTCFLMTGKEITEQGSNSVSAWFDDYFNNMFNPAYYLNSFGREEVLAYMLLVLWPLLVVGREARLFLLLPLPAVFLNVIANTSYLISAEFHYDHSTYAGVLIACLYALSRGSLSTLRSVTIAAVAVVIMFLFPTRFKNHPKELRDPTFWDLTKDEKVVGIEYLDKALPRGIVISAEYHASNYLLTSHNQVYMFGNPFISDYFGVYEVCDGVDERKLEKLPIPDIIVLTKDYEVEERAKSALIPYSFEEIPTKGIISPFQILVRKNSAYREKVLAIIKAAENSSTAQTQQAL